MELTKRLHRIFGGNSVVDLCERIVREAFPLIDSDSEPINPKFLCRLKGIPVALAEATEFLGRFHWRGGTRPAITIRTGLNAATERFVVAHELGHWLIQNSDAHRRQRFLSVTPTHDDPELDQEEILADALAVELLLPRGRVQNFAVDRLTPSELATRASAHGVSAEVYMRRLAGIVEGDLGLATLIPMRFCDLEADVVLDRLTIVEASDLSIRRPRADTYLRTRVPFAKAESELGSVVPMVADGVPRVLSGRSEFRPGMVPQLVYFGTIAR
ncbi:MAG: ImmA/IrrE family metallo-endopeptidase [Phycisphaeraceae bacterium]